MGQHQSSDLIGPALSAACSMLSRHPKVRVSDPDGERLLAELSRRHAVVRYLRTCRTRAVLDGSALSELLDLAEAWMADGQRRSLSALYAERLTSGRLDALGPRERNLHRIVFALAMRTGPRLILSSRFLGVGLLSECGDASAHPSPVMRSLRRLHERQLIELHEGWRSRQPGSATAVDLRPFLVPTSDEPSAEVESDLSLSSETLLALAEYERLRRSSRWAPSRAPRPTSAPAGAPDRGSGVHPPQVAPEAPSGQPYEALMAEMDELLTELDL